jgi:putative flippase GtrA
VLNLLARLLPVDHFGRLVRCFSVSVFTTLLSLGTLALLTADLGVSAWRANLVAVLIGTFPSYQLNRRWVWKVHGTSDLRREVVPFWALSLTGLVLSTLAVDRADHLCAALGLGGALRTSALLAANVGTFGALWIAQYLVLDRVLFRHRPSVTPDPKDLIDASHP